MELLIVTGASSGIGAGIAAAAAEDGTTIASISRRAGPGIFHPADLSSPDSWPGAFDWMEATIDDVDPRWVGLAHCAATLDPIGPAAEVDIAAYSHNVMLNSAVPQVLGAAFLQAAARRDLPATLLQISSGAASTAYPGWSSYCAAKAAVDQWTRSVALELPESLTVMSVAPGVVATAMQEQIRETPAARFPRVDKFHELHESGRLADPGDVGARLWSLMRRGNLESGSVVDLRSLEQG